MISSKIVIKHTSINVFIYAIFFIALIFLESAFNNNNNNNNNIIIHAYTNIFIKSVHSLSVPLCAGELTECAAVCGGTH